MGTPERPATPEILKPFKERPGLQARLILGGETLDPSKDIGEVEKDKLQEVAPDTTEKIEAKSIDLREKYWEEYQQIYQEEMKRIKEAEKAAAQKGEEQVQKENKKVDIKSPYEVWEMDIIAVFKRKKENQERINVLSELNIGVNFNNLDGDQVRNLYKRYFEEDNQGKIGGFKKFKEDVIKAYTDSAGKVDYEKLKKDLPSLQWFSTIFGIDEGEKEKFLSEIITQAIAAEAKAKSNPEKFAEEVNEEENGKIRGNRLEEDEKKLLEYLNSTPLPEPKPEPKPTPEPPTTQIESISIPKGPLAEDAKTKIGEEVLKNVPQEVKEEFFKSLGALAEEGEVTILHQDDQIAVIGDKIPIRWQTLSQIEKEMDNPNLNLGIAFIGKKEDGSNPTVAFERKEDKNGKEQTFIKIRSADDIRIVGRARVSEITDVRFLHLNNNSIAEKVGADGYVILSKKAYVREVEAKGKVVLEDNTQAERIEARDDVHLSNNAQVGKIEVEAERDITLDGNAHVREIKAKGYVSLDDSAQVEGVIRTEGTVGYNEDLAQYTPLTIGEVGNMIVGTKYAQGLVLSNVEHGIHAYSKVRKVPPLSFHNPILIFDHGVSAGSETNEEDRKVLFHLTEKTATEKLKEVGESEFKEIEEGKGIPIPSSTEEYKAVKIRDKEGNERNVLVVRVKNGKNEEAIAFIEQVKVRGEDNKETTEVRLRGAYRMNDKGEPTDEEQVKFIRERVGLDESVAFEVVTTPSSTSPESTSKLSLELARTDEDRYKTGLFNLIEREYPLIYQVWNELEREGKVSRDRLTLDNENWECTSDKTDGIVIGTQPMPEEIRKSIIFENQGYDYPHLMVYKLSHELSHKLVAYLITQSEVAKRELEHLNAVFIQLRKDNPDKGIIPLANLSIYREEGAEIQSKEEITELVNMYLIDPEYLRRYLDFLTRDEYQTLRDKYGLIKIEPDVAQALFDTIDVSVKQITETESPQVQQKEIKANTPFSEVTDTLKTTGEFNASITQETLEDLWRIHKQEIEKQMKLLMEKLKGKSYPIDINLDDFSVTQNKISLKTTIKINGGGITGLSIKTEDPIVIETDDKGNLRALNIPQNIQVKIGFVAKTSISEDEVKGIINKARSQDVGSLQDNLLPQLVSHLTSIPIDSVRLFLEDSKAKIKIKKATGDRT